MRRAGFVVLALAILTSGWGAAEAQESGFTVVTHQSNPIDSMSNRDLARLFLKQKTRWANGGTARPIDQRLAAPVRALFSQVVLSRDIAEVESYWNGQVFAGRSTPPPSAGSDDEVLDFVRRTPGAVGYVSSSSDTGGVKVLSVSE